MFDLSLYSVVLLVHIAAAIVLVGSAIFAPFTRCMACNGVLRPVAREDVEDRLLPDTRRFYREFSECPGCRRVFWDGSHARRMRARVEAWLTLLDRPSPE